MKNSLLTIFISLGFTCSSYAQMRAIPLEIKQKQDSDIIFNKSKIGSISNENTFTTPNNLTPDFRIFIKDVSTGQLLYEKYGRSIFKNKSANVDSLYVTDSFVGNNNFHVYVGVDFMNKKKYVIVDSNNNKDFSDDSVYSFDINKQGQKKSVITSVDISRFNGEECESCKYQFLFYPETEISPELLESKNGECFQISESESYYHLGKTKIGDIYFYIYIDNRSNFPDRMNREAARILFCNSNYKQDIFRKVGDIIIQNNRMIQIVDVKVDSIMINDLGESMDSSVVGSYIPEINTRSVKNPDSVIIINQFIKKKYVLIDFWGSWCTPCIAALPKLKEMYEQIKFRDDVMIIGIALERETELAQLDSVVNAYDLKWLNVWNPRSDIRQNLSSPQEKLKIYQYPTYIILDKSGKIVFNTNDSSCKREDAIDFFLKLINSK